MNARWILPIALLSATRAGAEEADLRRAAPPRQSPEVRDALRQAEGPISVLHVPRAHARNDGRDLAIRATVRNDWLAERVVLHYRRIGERDWRAVDLAKDRAGEYAALVPDAFVTAPGFEYYIESVLRDGRRVRNFASPEHPQQVQVRDLSHEARRARRLARHDGARYDFAMGFKFLNAGVKEFEVQNGERRAYRDSFNRVDLDFAYRILSDYIYQISFSFGMLGAKLGVSRPLASLAADPTVDSRFKDPAARDTGVYLGRARATWEIADLVGLDLAVILGANHKGFAVGGGGTLRLGRLTGTHLDIGIEIIQETGYDFWMEFAWDTVPRTMMSLRADLTTWPSQNDGLAVFPSFNVRYALTRNAYLGAFIGYGTRFRYQRGGVSGGAQVGYQF
jgi:hypothetical protein